MQIFPNRNFLYCGELAIPHKISDCILKYEILIPLLRLLAMLRYITKYVTFTTADSGVAIIEKDNYIRGQNAGALTFIHVFTAMVLICMKKAFCDCYIYI